WQWQHANSQPSGDRLLRIEAALKWADPYGTPKGAVTESEVLSLPSNGHQPELEPEAEPEPEPVVAAEEQLPLPEITPSPAYLKMLEAANELVTENRRLKIENARLKAEVEGFPDLQRENDALRASKEELRKENRRLAREIRHVFDRAS